MAKINKEEVKEEETIEIKKDDKGRYVFPPFEMYIDDEENTKVINLVIQKPQNLQLYNTALYRFMNDNDPRAFGSMVFKNIIAYPKEARDINFWDYDIEALPMIAISVVEILGKKKKILKRNLNFNL